MCTWETLEHIALNYTCFQEEHPASYSETNKTKKLAKAPPVPAVWTPAQVSLRQQGFSNMDEGFLLRNKAVAP